MPAATRAPGAERASAAGSPLARARVSLALGAVASAGFAAFALFGADAETQRAAALARAADYQRERPYLDAPLEVLLSAHGEEGALLDAVVPDDATVAGEQAELDALLAELATADRATPAARFGLKRGAASPQRLALHALIHASLLHLLWNLALLASAGVQLERRLGHARTGALLLTGGAAGAALQLTASAPDAAPLVGLSAATASLVGALAMRPGGPPRDPLAPRGSRAPRSPIRIVAALAVVLCVLAVLLGVSALAFAPLALLAGCAAGALAMLGFARAGWLHGESAPLAPEVAQALALLDAGPEGAPAALELLRKRLANADDPLAARALALALRGRADAPEALAQALVAAVRAKRRQSALAAWRELVRAGATPRAASAELRELAGWLRSDGALGEARAVALVALEGASAEEAARLAREARRADPALAQRAAERALALPALGATERKALEELLAQARRDARAAGVIVLDANAEARSEALRGVVRRPMAPLDVSELAGDDRALDLAESVADGPAQPAATPDEVAPGAPEPPETASPALLERPALFERAALELTDADPTPLPDPESAGEAALLDALHQALTADGGELGLEESPAPPQAPAPAEAAPARERAPLPAPAAAARPLAALPTSTAAAAPRAADFAFGDADDPLFADAVPDSPPLRPLQVSAARPVRLASEAIVLEIEGRGRAKLGYDKIDAVAAAGVKGLSSSGKAVLLIDLAIGLAGEGLLRVVRLRADGFDPRELVAGHSSPLAALRALVAELRARTRGVALPREAAASAPFRIYADLASYEREAFGAERK